MSRNWEELGIEWIEETVSKQAGDHATDRAVIGKAQMPIVRDLPKFVGHFGDGCVLGIMDGTSVRVMAQDVNRRGIQKGMKPEAIREAIYNRLIGVRNAPRATVRTVEVKIHNLPNGTTYSGTDLVEYRQLYLSALVDAGVAVSVAQQIALMQTL